MDKIKKYSRPTVLYLSHGAGPMPLLDDDGHKEMVENLKIIAAKIVKPSAIILVSAHWEAASPTITLGANPSLIYDYYGFPKQAYEIQYPAPGEPNLARTVFSLLSDKGLESILDDKRGFDHGSGFSFHNMKAFFAPSTIETQSMNESFEHWLIETCSDPKLDEIERTNRLVNWENAPSARYCHPREEHLLPLHVCYGVAKHACREFFDLNILGKKASVYLW
jgi:4,5-DOPA dioxygenase extradiol